MDCDPSLDPTVSQGDPLPTIADVGAPSASTLGSPPSTPRAPRFDPAATIADTGTRTDPGGDRYEVCRMIGSGGMGQVFLARDRNLRGRWVAIKRLSRILMSDAHARERFDQEAESIARLSDHHIVRVFERGEDASGPYIVMEYIPGPTPSAPLSTGDWPADLPHRPLSLHEYVRAQGARPVTEVVALGVKLSGALRKAHSRGIIHRDVKPANVLLDEDFEPKLVDFGLAHAPDAHAKQLTLPGAQMRTFGFGAPEQERDAANVDERADVYGLGATLWFTLSGESAEFFRESEAPAELRPILAKSLKRNPDDRYASASEFRSALEQLRLAEVGADGMSAACPSCGKVSAPGVRFCTSCGHSLAELFSACPNCQRDNRMDIVFCGGCGLDLRNHRQASASIGADSTQGLDDGRQTGKVVDDDTLPLAFEGDGARLASAPAGVRTDDLVLVDVIAAKEDDEKDSYRVAAVAAERLCGDHAAQESQLKELCGVHTQPVTQQGIPELIQRINDWGNKKPAYIRNLGDSVTITRANRSRSIVAQIDTTLLQQRLVCSPLDPRGVTGLTIGNAVHMVEQHLARSSRVASYSERARLADEPIAGAIVTRPCNVCGGQALCTSCHGTGQLSSQLLVRRRLWRQQQCLVATDSRVPRAMLAQARGGALVYERELDVTNQGSDSAAAHDGRTVLTWVRQLEARAHSLVVAEPLAPKPIHVSLRVRAIVSDTVEFDYKGSSYIIHIVGADGPVVEERIPSRGLAVASGIGSFVKSVWRSGRSDPVAEAAKLGDRVTAAGTHVHVADHDMRLVTALEHRGFPITFADYGYRTELDVNGRRISLRITLDGWAVRAVAVLGPALVEQYRRMLLLNGKVLGGGFGVVDTTKGKRFCVTRALLYDSSSPTTLSQALDQLAMLAGAAWSQPPADEELFAKADALRMLVDLAMQSEHKPTHADSQQAMFRVRCPTGRTSTTLGHLAGRSGAASHFVFESFSGRASHEGEERALSISGEASFSAAALKPHEGEEHFVFRSVFPIKGCDSEVVRVGIEDSAVLADRLAGELTSVPPR